MGWSLLQLTLGSQLDQDHLDLMDVLSRTCLEVRERVGMGRSMVCWKTRLTTASRTWCPGMRTCSVWPPRMTWPSNGSKIWRTRRRERTDQRNERDCLEIGDCWDLESVAFISIGRQ